MIYHYYDGSGNQFKIETQSLEYIPIEPMESSSGIYSGGEPYKIEITAEQFNQIQNLFEKAFKSKKEHSKERAKLTGMLSIEKNSEKKICILLPNSETKKNIELFLRQLKEK
jgi:flavodoxin